MSIPRIAIERPVTMFMISMVIILLGGISLTRLPVDLLPDIAQPTVNVRVAYAGVGPLEIEELITRPLEQQLSAVSGLERINSTSQEGQSQIRLNFTWGHDLNEAMNDVRMRIDRVRGRLPEEADPPIVQKFDPTQMPIMGLGVESSDGRLDRVQLRELAAKPLSVAGDPKAVDDLAGRLARLETVVATPRSPIADPALANRIATLEGDLKALGERVGVLGRRNDEIASIAGEARTRADALAMPAIQHHAQLRHGLGSGRNKTRGVSIARD